MNTKMKNFMNKLRLLAFMLLYLNFYNNLYGEEIFDYPFDYVELPDSIPSSLKSAYGNPSDFVELFDFYNNLHGEEILIIPFDYVEVPDSIASLIKSAYGFPSNFEGDLIVRNMTIRNDVEFQPGMYVFYVMGPHFKKMFFIYKKQLYIFNNAMEYELVNEKTVVNDMLTELYECRDSLKLNEYEMSLYKSAIISIFKKKQYFVEDTLNKKVEIHEPFPTDAIDGKWHVQTKFFEKNKKMEFGPMYKQYYLTLQHAHSNMILIKNSIYENYNRLEQQTIQHVTKKINRMYKIVKMAKSKSKYYMLIRRKIDKNKYELYYLSKKTLE